jgi:hypothetical protein
VRQIRIGESVLQRLFAGVFEQVLGSLEEARTMIEDWRVEYNAERPHRALG